MSNIQEHLTESNLINFLNSIITDEVPIIDKAFPNHRFRPDYRYDKNKLIVEFDGYRHYSVAKVVLKDKETTKIMEDSGYKVVRIPYFIQLDSNTIYEAFGIHSSYTNNYPHGFISDAALLPADFCSIGILRFMDDMDKFKSAREAIKASLRKRSELTNILEVIPPQLIGWI